MNIKELMTDDLSKVNDFVAACDDMINSRYILAEGKMIKILQVVATSTVLQRIIGSALKGFDYAAMAMEWQNGLKLPLPEKEHIALTFCILADIDSRKIYLNDFLRKFFWDGDINSSYTSFCTMLIEPFKNYVAGAPGRAKREDAERKMDRTEVNVRYSGTFGANDEVKREGKDIERLATDLANAIERYDKFGRNEKEEYIYMCDTIADKARTDISGARALAQTLQKLINAKELEPYISEVIARLI